MKKIILFLLMMLCLHVYSSMPEQESLGNPIKSGKCSTVGSTRAADGTETVWTRVSLPERRGILGIDIKTGKTTWVDFKKYGSHVMLVRVHPNGKVYTFLHNAKSKDITNSGMLIEYNPQTKKTKDISIPLNGRYFMPITGDIAPDGTIYVGAYPNVQLGWYNPYKGKVGATKRIEPDIKQKYILYVLASDDGVIYFTTGLHHPSLWSFNPVTKEAKQILPEKFKKMTQKGGLFRGQDGVIYAKYGADNYKCFPDHVENVKIIPALVDMGENSFPGKYYLADGRKISSLDSDGVLNIYNPVTKKNDKIVTDFPPFSPLVYSICPGLDGNILVGGFGTAALASFKHNDAMPEYINHRRYKHQGTQIYWSTEFPDRFYFSVYIGGLIKRFEKKKGITKTIVCLAKKELQERIFMLVPGPDDKLYGPTMPIKGHLGGGIVVFNPKDDTYKFYRNVIKNQSIRAVAVASDDLLFGVSDIFGGTSSIPKAKNAKVFLWNVATQKVEWSATPLKGEKYYLGAYSLDDDRFWTIGMQSNKIVVVNVRKRIIEKIIQLPKTFGIRPVGSTPALGDCAVVLGGNGLYCVDIPSGKLIKILTSPEMKKKFAGSLHGTHAEYLAPDGTVYFGSESGLYRIRLKKFDIN